MRVLAIDVGARRVGLAISDRLRLLARPLTSLQVRDDEDALAQIVTCIHELASDDDGLAQIVVGLPRHLDGTPSGMTARVLAFIEALKQRVTIPITTGDERLSSREAESRLAIRERDWRKRKAKLDAAAAAVFLQDYLDNLDRSTNAGGQGEPQGDQGDQ